METGSTDRYANYTSGHGSDNLTFIYTIQSGDKTCDLDYNAVNSLLRNGGTIKDNSSNDAVLTLPNPGSNGSLGRNKAIRINPASAKCPSP